MQDRQSNVQGDNGQRTQDDADGALLTPSETKPVEYGAWRPMCVKSAITVDITDDTTPLRTIAAEPLTLGRTAPDAPRSRTRARLSWRP